MQLIALGLDVGKYKFEAALLMNHQYKIKSFDNTTAGHHALLTWINKYAIGPVHACLEATSAYTQSLATYLFQANIKVSVVNPLRVKGFAQTQLSRNKTDRADAKLIALFCHTLVPDGWQPEAEHIQTLQALARRLDALMDLQSQEQNRLAVSHPATQASIQAILTVIEQQLMEVKTAIDALIQQHADLKQKRVLLESIKLDNQVF